MYIISIMINNNKFFIKKLKTVIFIGYTPNIDDLIKVNSKNKIKSHIITSSKQEKLFKTKQNIKSFEQLDNKFENYIKKNFNISETLFLSISPMFIIKKNIIDFLQNNFINFTPSRLPFDTGRGGFSWHILREDKIYNQTFQMTRPDQNGDIIENETSLFPQNCKIPIDYEDYKLVQMVSFYNRFLKKIIKGDSLKLRAIESNIGRHNRALNTLKDGFINWNYNAHDLYNFINAFDDPHQGASTFLDRGSYGRLFLKKVHLHGGDTSNHPIMSGTVSRHDKKWIVVCTTGKYMMLIEDVLNEKGKNIINDIRVGDKFYTPYKFIEDSSSKAIDYES